MDTENALLESMNALLEAALTDKDMFKLIEEDIKKVFGIDRNIPVEAAGGNVANDDTVWKEVSVDEARRLTGDEKLGTQAPVSKEGDQNTESKPVPIEKDNPPDGYMWLHEYIRVYASGLLTYPADHGGWGIGDSQKARNRTIRLFASGLRPKPKDPANPSGTWLMPPERPIDLSNITIADIRNPEKLPAEMKDYIALISRRYIRGMLRVCFEEFGLKSYIIYHNKKIQDALGKLADVKPKWNFNAMYNFAHKVMPEFVLRAIIAPMVKTPNCDAADLKQNAEYLGKDNLELMQDMVDPVDTPVDGNLCVQGNRPLDYRHILRMAAQSNYDAQKLADTARHDNNGNLNRYNPPEDEDGTLPAIASADSLAVSAESDDKLEYPKQKIGKWYIVEIDKRHKEGGNANTDDAYVRDGYFTVSEDVSPTGKFYFRGGTKHSNSPDSGVGKWCITGGSLNGYSNFSCNDCAYFLIHEDAAKDYVLNTSHSTGGNTYDSSAFGVIVAGSGTHPGSDNIPGLIRYECFEGRANNTYCGSNQPGDPEAYKYDTRIIPSGGDIPGIIHISERWNGTKKNHARCINNSIFCLDLIGKWDPSIRVQDENGELIYDELVNLMQKWFPVSLDGQAVSARKNHMEMFRLDDIMSMGEILENLRKTDLAAPGSYVFNLDGVPWYQIGFGENFCIFTNANKYIKLKGKLDRNEIDDKTFAEGVCKLDAIGFYEDDGGMYPISTSPMPFGDINTIAKDGKFAKDDSESGVSVDDSLPSPGEDGIAWLNPSLGAAKKHRIGISGEGNIVITDTSGDSEDRQELPIKASNLPITITGNTRGTYLVTDEGETNLWIIGERDGKTVMNIVYVRNGRAKTFEVVGNILGDTTNAILRHKIGNEYRYALGDLKGNPAQLERLHADRYFAYIIMCAGSRNIDMLGIDADYIYDMCNMNHLDDCVGLAVANGNVVGDNGVVGTIDWYTHDTMRYITSTDVTVADLMHDPTLPHFF